jgi:beta-lactamase class A
VKSQGAGLPRSDLGELFAAAHCDGGIHVLDLAHGAQVGLSDEAVFSSASVFKVQVALAFFQLVAEGKLDDATTMTVNPQLQTVGPTGISIFRDPVTLSLHDLAVQMLTVSDNSATDVLISVIGFGPIQAVAEHLGLSQTAIETDCQGLLQSLAKATGRRHWQELVSSEHDPSPDQVLGALAEAGPIRTSPRDCTKLLSAIWSPAPGPAAAAKEVRRLMAQQLTRNGIAAGFPQSTKVAAKSGTLIGVVRNEIGVVEYEDGSRYAAAVFTKAWEPYAYEQEINASIGKAVRTAIEWLRAGQA